MPPVALEGRELPRPFRCWATTNTEDCFKAFDKKENAPWRSADVGGWAGALAQTQVLTLDVGDGYQLAPTKLRIKCGVRAAGIAERRVVRLPALRRLGGRGRRRGPSDGQIRIYRGAPRPERTRRAAGGLRRERPFDRRGVDGVARPARGGELRVLRVAGRLRAQRARPDLCLVVLWRRRDLRRAKADLWPGQRDG